MKLSLPLLLRNHTSLTPRHQDPPNLTSDDSRHFPKLCTIRVYSLPTFPTHYLTYPYSSCGMLPTTYFLHAAIVSIGGQSRHSLYLYLNLSFSLVLSPCFFVFHIRKITKKREKNLPKLFIYFVSFLVFLQKMSH